MKKLVAFIALAAFISACSQYTCPTYAKKEAPKKTTTLQKI
jgi:PBP1b-binding outer membrane lipoprotein LpoB